MTEPTNEPIPAEQPAEAAAPADPLAEAAAKIAALEADMAKTKDAALRAMADAENMRKRAEREIAEREKYAVGNFAKALLAVSDNLRRALDAVSAEARAADPHLAKLAEGVELTERELLSVFERNGVAKIDAAGKPFDPALQQAVAHVDAPGVAAGCVVQVFQPGYTIHGRLLREAMVTVAKGAPPAGVDTVA
ncbi:MAG: nucleotide exchange factor GrpE [Rhodospirillales bacterium]|nr:nucleotide exchange factor GrpE [Rhodospirillales bacterium]